MTSRPLRIGVVAGEHSGDILGAKVIRKLRKRYPDIEIYGIGGARMISEGVESIFPMLPVPSQPRSETHVCRKRSDSSRLLNCAKKVNDIKFS